MMTTSGSTDARIRIAVLGGGAASLAAAYRLSADPRFEITVYQMGWRLGGKGASGRRLSDGRDQEHGLHVLGGFYHNAMGLLRELYADWARCSQYALPFETAFRPHSEVHVMERGPDGNHPVRFPFPENRFELGLDPRELNLRTVAEQLLSFIVSHAGPDRPSPRGAPYTRDPAFLGALSEAQVAASPAVLDVDRGAAIESAFAADPFERALAIVQRPPLVSPPIEEQEPDYGILFEIALVVARGILAQGLWWRGFDAANAVEFTDWMEAHGLSQRARDSAYFRCGYDYAFAYVDGDDQRPSMAAGAGLRGFLRMVLTYNKSVFVHMYGGMGEIVFVPFFEVLKSRGVAFKFFHRVDTLTYDPAKRRIARIAGIVQNEPKEPGYDPLLAFTPGVGPDHLVWPEAPIATRLRHPVDAAERAEFAYESPYYAPASSGSFDLVADRDFDLCVLGIPVGALQDIASDLATHIREWRDMLASAATTPTLAAQLWQASDTAALGWPHGPTILTANAPALSTWADMSYLLPLEVGAQSRHLSYFCGPVPRVDYPAGSDPGPAELARALSETRTWCAQQIAELLPAAVIPAVAGVGSANELYVRLNSFPSDLYVLTPPGTVAKRLAPADSRVESLFLAGDWTRNGFDIGSFETAVLSGLQCAGAISGDGRRLPGEKDLGW